MQTLERCCTTTGQNNQNRMIEYVFRFIYLSCEMDNGKAFDLNPHPDFKAATVRLH